MERTGGEPRPGRRTRGSAALSAAQARFVATERWGDVSALLERPPDARWLLAFAHGAGAGIHHPFMESMSGMLARRGVATLRYQFPYMERGRRPPDPQPILLETVRAAIGCAAEMAEGLPVLFLPSICSDWQKRPIKISVSPSLTSEWPWNLPGIYSNLKDVIFVPVLFRPDYKKNWQKTVSNFLLK